MKVRPLNDGSPGDRQGITHTVKHYLSHRELWQDIAEKVPPSHRALTVWRRFANLTPPVCDQWKEPSAELRAAWPTLSASYREGYLAIIEPLLEAFPSPYEDQTLWAPQRRTDRWAAHVGEGVVAVVASCKDGWQLRTAFRALKYTLRDYERPPRDATNVEIRKGIARSKADRQIAMLRRRR